MLRVLVHIQRNLDRDLSLEELARIACFSPYHFHRIFRGMTGETLAVHIRRIRLERAALRLATTRRAILDIALEAGYESHEAFTRAFGAMTGLSPSRFRERRRLVSENGTARVRFDPEGGAEDFQPIDTGGSNMDARMETIGPLRVAFVRHTGPYDECGKAWGTLCAVLGPKGLLGPDTRFLGLCHDDPEVTPPEKIRYDACAVVDERFQPEGEVGAQVLPEGEYAMALHRGPYSGLAAAYAELCGQWVARQGREVASAPSLEFYRNDPNTTAPEDLLTEICVPLEPAE
ncbi:MAG: AraC family transcriptional regulator [Candidatus Eisenbacteria bacterium]|nr:AraC family transcriptional regulator [Candidatus Eisenbacteria bacterium]